MRFTTVLCGGLAFMCGCIGQVETDDPRVGDPDGASIDGGAEPPIGLVDGGGVDGTVPPGVDAGGSDAGAPDTGPPRIVWKAAVMAGDDSINAFDNARETMYGMFLDDGILPENTVQLTRSGETGVRDMSFENLLNGMIELDVGPTDGCVIFMTSHGSPSGFYIAGRSTLAPDDLNDILDEACGDRPTVALISACYSGVFVEPVRKPNRIILTAARSDRTSFGCSAGATYTFWDGCLIDNFPMASTWEDLYERVTACVVDLERGGYTPSEPQAYFGDSMLEMPIFDRR